MAASAQAAHLPAISVHEREQIGHELQGTLAELIDLALFGKQLHWNVTGPHFRELHLALDELVDSWRILADTVAERAVALGHAPDGQSATIANAISGIETGPLADRVVVRELTTRLAELCERVRGRMDRLGELDAASQDVVIEVLRELEKQLWMTRVQLAG